MGRANFHPEAGNAKGESVDRLTLSAGLYRNHDDPQGLMRNNAGTPTRGLMDGVPLLIPYSRPKIWNFDNAYDVNTTNVFTQGAVGSGTPLACAGMGLGLFTNAAADNDFYQYWSKYTVAAVTDGKGIWFRCPITISDALQSDVYVGLADLINGGSIDAVHTIFDLGAGNRIDGIGFKKTDGDAIIYAECMNTGLRTTVAVGTLVSAAEIVLGFHVDTDGAVYFFVDDVYAGFINTYLPGSRTDLYFQFGLRNGEAVAKNMQIGQTVLMQDI